MTCCLAKIFRRLTGAYLSPVNMVAATFRFKHSRVESFLSRTITLERGACHWNPGRFHLSINCGEPLVLSA
ncbi:MAG TPA: hypothetical protein VK619_04040 [Pyrinomonadaceae bacterium]|nr:hypothetical protein [Pyrinomonadaceae bacterium]